MRRHAARSRNPPSLIGLARHPSPRSWDDDITDFSFRSAVEKPNLAEEEI